MGRRQRAGGASQTLVADATLLGREHHVPARVLEVVVGRGPGDGLVPRGRGCVSGTLDGRTGIDNEEREDEEREQEGQEVPQPAERKLGERILRRRTGRVTLNSKRLRSIADVPSCRWQLVSASTYIGPPSPVSPTRTPDQCGASTSFRTSASESSDKSGHQCLPLRMAAGHRPKDGPGADCSDHP